MNAPEQGERNRYGIDERTTTRPIQQGNGERHDQRLSRHGQGSSGHLTHLLRVELDQVDSVMEAIESHHLRQGRGKPSVDRHFAKANRLGSELKRRVTLENQALGGVESEETRLQLSRLRKMAEEQDKSVW